MESKNAVGIREEVDATKDLPKQPNRSRGSFRTRLATGISAATESLTIEWNREYQSSIRSAHLEIKNAADGFKPQVFYAHLGRWCDRLVDLQRKLISDYTELALANPRAITGSTLNWLRDSVNRAWIPLAKGYRGWIICACDWDEVTDEWRAPCWLSQALQPAEFPTVPTRDARLSNEDTSRVVAGILGFIEIRLVHAQKRDFNGATVRIASARVLRQTQPRQDLTKAVIAQLKADNPGISQAKICSKLDARQVPVPKPWQEYERTWSHALRHPKLKSRVKKHISSVKPGKRRMSNSPSSH
jgi:hypothetical protein